MKIKETKIKQLNRLEELCLEQNIDFKSMTSLLDGVKTKKLSKKNHFLSEKIRSTIEKAIK